MTDPTTAWEIVERAKAGDRDAFAQIYRDCHPSIQRFVYFRVGNVTVAEDITAEVFTRALKSIGSVQFQGRDIRAWLTTIARNLVADHFKSCHYRLSIAVADNGHFDRADDNRFAEPGEELFLADATAALLSALDRLTPFQRQVIKLRYIDEVSGVDTAALMERDHGAIKALAYRGMRSLEVDQTLRRAVCP